MSILPSASYFLSKIVLSNVLQNLRENYVFAVNFGKTDILRSANVLPRKIGR